MPERSDPPRETSDPSWAPLLETLPLGVLIADASGQFREANSAATRILGHPRQVLLASGLPEPRAQMLAADGTELPPDEAPGVIALRTGKPVHRRVLGVVQGDGNVLWLEVSAEPLPVGGVLVSFEDVTRHHLTESILAARARIAELAATASLQEVLRATLDEAERLTGSSIGFYHFVEPDQRSITLQAWSTRTLDEFCTALGGGRHYPLDEAGVWAEAARTRRPIIHNDFAQVPNQKGMPAGHATVLRELVVPVLRGDLVVAMLGVGNKPFPYGSRDLQTILRLADLAWDIAERKRSEVALKDSETRYRSQFENMTQGAFRQRADGSFTDVNPAALSMLGLSREEFLGRTSLSAGWDIVQEDGMPLPIDQYPSMVAWRTGDKVLGKILGILNPRTGRRVWVEANAIPEQRDEAAGRSQVLVTLHDITARREALDSIRESQSQLNRVVVESPFPVMVHAEDGEIIQLSRSWCEITGYPPEELRTMEDWAMRAFGMGFASVLSEVRQFFDTQAPRHEGDFTIRTRHGEQRLWRFSSTLTGRLRDGRQLATTMAVDLTERNRISAALAASEARARTMLRTAMDGVGLVDERGRFQEVNETACRMLGYTRDELIGMPVAELESQETQSDVLAHIAKVLDQGWDLFEGRLRRKDGTEFPVEVSVTSQPNQQQLVVFARDITDRKRASLALLQSERQYRSLFDTMAEGFALHELLTDDEGHPFDYRYLDVNPAFVAMTGLARDRWLGRTAREIHPGLEPRWLREYGQVALAGKPITFEDEFSDLDRWYRITAYRPAPRQFAVLVTDITGQKRIEAERKQLEQQVARTQKMESLGSLAGGVAHDMNNVLGAIMGLASVHQEQAPAGSRLHKSMATILKACTRGRTLVKGLLGFARQGLEEIRVLDLNEVIREEVALLERTIPPNVRIETDLLPGLRLIHGDPAALSHVLMNLCLNAVDAMPEGGTLTLRTRHGEPGQVSLEVADTGSGMAPEVLEKALDPFFTTKGQGKGTGLGLAIVYGAVKAHHGQLEIASSPGSGTRIVMRFPATSEAPLPGPAPPSRSPEGQPLKVLVVDDDELILDSLGELLRGMGHQPTMARSGEEALDLLEQGLAIDVVLLDLNMPGLGGMGTLPRLRAARPDLPVLLATGRADQLAMDLVTRTMRTMLLPKPFSTEEIASHLRQLGLS